MNLFAIGDLHLPGGTSKTMDRFGEHWKNHDQKIFGAWERTICSDDLVLVVGDTSWAMHLNEALPDLDRIGNMPGRKILIKGNHDYWWGTQAKMSRVLHSSITTLQGNSIIVNRIAVVGTRGWVCPNDAHFKDDDARIYEREVGRLRNALATLRSREGEFDTLIVALHYPPTNTTHEPSDFTALIEEYKADVCVYGHLHGDDIRTALTGVREKTRYYLVSADAANFSPAAIDLQ